MYLLFSAVKNSSLTTFRLYETISSVALCRAFFRHMSKKKQRVLKISIHNRNQKTKKSSLSELFIHFCFKVKSSSSAPEKVAAAIMSLSATLLIELKKNSGALTFMSFIENTNYCCLT